MVISGYDQSNVLIQLTEDLMIQNGDLIVTNQLREAGEGVKVIFSDGFKNYSQK